MPYPPNNCPSTWQANRFPVYISRYLCVWGELTSAGGGKSFALLLDALRGVNDPYFTGVIFRKNYAMLKSPGSLIDVSFQIYPLVGGVFKSTFTEWIFPSGAKIAFRHLQQQNSHFDYQGSQFSFVGFDELTHIKNEEQFKYILSRCRTIANFNPWVRATCNPDPEAFIAKWIEWWLDDDGYPIPAKSGILRYFINLENNLIWADSREELIEKYPESRPKSFTFIPSTIHDNQILLENNPEYIASLMALHPVEQARLLKGNWKANYEAGKVFHRMWFKNLPTLPSTTEYRRIKTVRFWDLAATSATTATDTSFYTAGIRMSKWRHLITNKYLYVVEDQIAEQVAAGEVPNLMMRTAHFDGEDVLVRWELEGGASALILEQKIADSLPFHDAIAVKPLGNKVTRALPYATAAYNGIVYLLDNEWNSVYLNCVQGFDGSKKPLINDVVDASSGAYSELQGMSAEELNSAWIS